MPILKRESSKATVTLRPARITVAPGEVIAVDVYVEDISDLFGAQLRLAFNADVLRVLDTNDLMPGSQVVPGDFLDVGSGQGFVVENSVDNSRGIITYSATKLSPAKPVSGNGSLVQITFEAISEGRSQFTIDRLLLSDNAAQPISVAVKDGGVVVTSSLIRRMLLGLRLLRTPMKVLRSFPLIQLSVLLGALFLGASIGWLIRCDNESAATVVTLVVGLIGSATAVVMRAREEELTDRKVFVLLASFFVIGGGAIVELLFSEFPQCLP